MNQYQITPSQFKIILEWSVYIVIGIIIGMTVAWIEHIYKNKNDD